MSKKKENQKMKAGVNKLSDLFPLELSEEEKWVRDGDLKDGSQRNGIDLNDYLSLGTNPKQDELQIMRERLSALIETIHFGYFDNITRKQQLYLEKLLLIVYEFTELNCYVNKLVPDKNRKATRWDRD